jgi:hypothetical protein
MILREILLRFSRLNFIYYTLYFVGRIFLFKSDVLKSKWFKNNFIGYIWLIKAIWFQRILGFHRFSGYFVHHSTVIGVEKNLIVHPDSIDAFTSPGCYFQCFDAKIFIEKDVLIAPNVGLITANHDPENPNVHLPGRDIIIRSGCWIGMNSIILPGVELAEGTIVAAGSVVTKSFLQGNVLIAGAPAIVKRSISNINV